MDNNGAFIGTELKYTVNITAAGFSMETDDFEVDLCRGPRTIHFDKGDMPMDGQGKYYICFDSADLGPGIVTCVVTAHVPDADFEDGFRDEVYSFELVNLKSTPKK